MDIGTNVWVKSDDAMVWQAGEVIDYQDANGLVPVRFVDSSTTVYRLDTELYLRNMSTTFSTTSSLTSLEHLHEPAVLQALHERFDHDQIYTSIGDILVALNPFKPLPNFYTDTQLNAYKQHIMHANFVATETLPPHVFSIGSKAFGGLLKPERRNQSILVSGESGSGKTESTKFLMQFLTSVGSDASLLESDKSDAVEIGKRILQTNPILESFGNAQTIRNDNSSRFGKFVTIQFGQKNEIVGAQITSYLLEKVRVLHQNPNERNFHIFYELLEGADKQVLDMLGLTRGGKYEILNSYGPKFIQQRAMVDKYARLYTDTIRAFEDTGVLEQERLDIFKILAALLHLGNINFIGQGKQDDAAAVTAASRPSLEKCAELMGVDVDKLATLLSHREMKAGVEVMVLQHTSGQAKEICRSLAKAIYGRLFTWLVRRLSDEMNYLNSTGSMWEEGEELATIGILDIFGFESLNRNGFEQLCINYANERLQAQFNEFVFVREQHVYVGEEIDWTTISFSSNAACLALFDDKSDGIFSLLDQECLMPKGSNQALCTKFYRYHGEKASLDSTRLSQQPQLLSQGSFRRLKSSFTRHVHRAEKQREFIDQGVKTHPFSASKLERVNHQFVISHFAGRVCYDVEQFVEKNTDTLPTDASDILASASNAVVAAIGADENMETDADSGTGGRRRYSMLRAPSVSAEFKCQLDRLIAQIERTEAHYVRCLKPNEVKKPGIFDRERMVEQMRSVGLLEAVRIARHGYSVRLAHATFIEQFSGFKIYLKPPDRAVKMSKFNLVQALVTILRDKMLLEEGVELKNKSFSVLARVTDDESSTASMNDSRRKNVQVGKTLVFCKSSTYNRFSQYRVELRTHCATVLQKNYRGYRHRAVYRTFRCSVVRVQTVVRVFLARSQLAQLRHLRREKAATFIKLSWRRCCIRRKFVALVEQKRRLDAVIVIQASFRRSLAKRRLAKMLVDEREATAATTIQMAFRHRLAQLKFARLQRNQLEMTAIRRIQASSRHFLAQSQQEKTLRELVASSNIQRCSRRWLKQNSNSIAKVKNFRLRTAFRNFRRAYEAAHRAGEMEAEPSPSDNSLTSRMKCKPIDVSGTLSSSEQEDSSASNGRMEPPLRISAPAHRRTNSRQRSRVNNRHRSRESGSHTDQRNLLLEKEILRLQQMLVEQRNGPRNDPMCRSRPPRSVPLDLSQSTRATRSSSGSCYPIDGNPFEGEDWEDDDDVSLLPPRRARSVVPTQDVDHVSKLSRKIEELDAKCKFLEQLVARNTYENAASESSMHSRGPLAGRKRFSLDGSSMYDDRCASEAGSDVDSIIYNMQNQMNMLQHSIAASEHAHATSRKSQAMSLSSSTRPTRSSSIASLPSFSNLPMGEAPRNLPSLPLSESQLSAGGSSHGHGPRSSLNYPSPPPSSVASSFYQSQPLSHFGHGRPRIVKWARSNNCYECEEPFNLFMRRHHCRMCGNSFCHEHSSRRVSVFGIGFDDEPVRVCDNCFAEYYTASQEHSTLQFPSQFDFKPGPLSSSTRLSGL